MKLFHGLIVVATLAPVASFAQRLNAPVTRAEVRAQLVQLEKAGYNPAQRDEATYPADIQAAEARVAAENGAAHTANTAVGGSAGGAIQSGHRGTAATTEPLYGHH